jgi:hypothetical protein
MPAVGAPAAVEIVGTVAVPVIVPVQPASGQLMVEEACPVPAVPGKTPPPWAAVRPLVVSVVAWLLLPAWHPVAPPVQVA